MIIYDAYEKDNQIVVNGVTESKDKLEKDIFFCGEIFGGGDIKYRIKKMDFVGLQPV